MKYFFIIIALLWSLHIPCFATVYNEKPMVVVIPSYNNEQWCLKNLVSVLQQKYSNYHIIFIDDCSTDNTFHTIQSFVNANKLQHKVTIIHNKHRVGALENLYTAIHSCPDHAIIVTLDGDDWFATDKALARVNREYQDNNTWLTYGQFVFYPVGQPGFCSALPDDVIQHNTFRGHPWVTSHLRTFYAGLFKKIDKEDLKGTDGQFYAVTWDQAMLLPMLEMAGHHVRFIPDILYVYNYNNPLNDEKTQPAHVLRCLDEIRQKPCYQRLKQLIIHGPDLVVFSYDRPLQLYALLESIEKNVRGLESIQVIYRSSSESFEQAYQEVQNSFSNVRFKKQQKAPYDFKHLVIESVFASSTSPYILFAVDDMTVKEPVNLLRCIEKMEQHHAYGFYLRLGLNLDYCYALGQSQPVPHHTTPEESLCLWTFKDSVHDWHYVHTVDMTIYRKKEIEQYIKLLSYWSPNTLEGEWAGRARLLLNRQGLCYKNTVVINTPLNRINQGYDNPHMHWKDTQELLNIFNQGLKIDIEPMQHIVNKSAHIHYEPTFVARKKG